MWKWIGGGAALVAVLALIVSLTLSGGDPASSLFGEPKLGPKALAAREVVASVNDHLQSDSILDSNVAKQVSCGAAARSAFDPMTGKNRFWFFRWEDGTVECYSTGGFHRVRGEALLPLGGDQIKVILGDPEKYPADTDFYSPPARVGPTPLPELGEGPCCTKR
jgi:hypothetical protein